MPTASIIELVDSMVAAVNAGWAPSAPNNAERVYLTPIDFTNLTWMHGRRVFFVPGDYENVPDTRGDSAWTYEIGVRVVERYEDAGNAGERAVRDWVDECVYFVETEVIDRLDFGALNAFRTALTDREIWTESIELLRLYEPELLHKKKVFLSDIAFVFREVR